MKMVARDVVMRSDFRAAQAGEERFGGVRASAVVRLVFDLVIHPLYREVRGQLVPMSRFVRMDG